MKISVIGAGQGGLRAAALLAAGGEDVTVFEKENEETLGIDWFDGVETKLFTDLGIEVPKSSFKGFSPSFIGPGSDKLLYLQGKPEDADWSVNRRDFSRQLVAEARGKGAKFRFGTAVERLIAENGTVKGIAVNGEMLASDLVIDSSGMFSPFRASLAIRMGMTAQPDEGDTFNVYRCICSQTENFPELPANEKFKMYLKFQNRSSISWCGVEPSGELNVLVGKVGRMDENERKELLSLLKAENPIIGEVIGDRQARASIPVRRPLAQFVCNGYAAVGDAAFMTIPVIGNGIANSIRAGQMLAETVLEEKSASAEALWKYQVKYYRSIGAVCYLLDWIKRGLLASDNAQLKGFLESGAVTDEDIRSILFGEGLHLTPKQWADKLGKIAASRGLFGVLLKHALQGVRAMLAACAIPPAYDPLKIGKWKEKTDALMR